jgi:multiple sugar transport system substrate-binding protein
MEKNPGVTSETEPTIFDQYWSKLNTQAAAGSLPDVMQHDVSYIKQYTDRNQLVDMYTYSKSGVIDLSKWSEAGLAPGILDGKLTGLVIGTNAWGMGLDPAVLQKAGVTIDDTKWTWADYERIGMEIFQKTGIQTMPHQQQYQIMEHITRQFGNGMYARDEKSLGMTNLPAAQAAYKGVIDIELRLKAAGALYDPDSAFIISLAMEEMGLAAGKTWNSWHWSNQHIGHQNAAKRPLEYIMLPTVSGPKAPYGLYFRASQYISMLATSNNKDLGAKFVNFFVNDLEANRILLAERGIPIPTDVRGDLYGRVDAANKYLFDYITKITPYASPANPPYPPAAGEVVDSSRSILLQVLTGKIASSDAALAQIIQSANAILSR